MQSEFDSVLPDPVAITDQVLEDCRQSQDYFPVMRALYWEAGNVLIATAGLMMAQPGYLPRDQAICVGLLVRMSKFMVAVYKLTEDKDRTEVVMALTRCILESATNLRYLLSKDDPTLFDRFVKRSLGPERELVDFIRENIRQNGGRPLVIEQRMLESIARKCELSGVDIEDIEPRPGDWGGGLRERLRALDREKGYVAFARMPSHAIHGDWVDLIQYHLEPKGEGFEPRFDWWPSDGELLMGISLFALDAANHYLVTYFDETDVAPLTKRIVDLQARFQKVSATSEDWDAAP